MFLEGQTRFASYFLLLEWQKEVPTDIAVVHVDHGIRAEAGEDARYVEQLCEERGIPFFLTRAEVRNRARMEKISEEEAGRRTRYEAFEKAAKEWGSHEDRSGPQQQ